MLERVAQLAERRQPALAASGCSAQGEPADGVYVVRVGHLRGAPAASDARTQAINTLTRGAVLGELALLSGSARSASVRALRDTSC